MPSFQRFHTVLPPQAPLPMVTRHRQAACEGASAPAPALLEYGWRRQLHVTRRRSPAHRQLRACVLAPHEPLHLDINPWDPSLLTHRQKPPEDRWN